jgi:CNT family concentrative nucleoside transporter
LVNDLNTSWGFIFAVKVLPIIIFFGALMALLFYLRIIQVLVAAISYCVQPLIGTTGAETLCAIANSFLGQTEAPLLIRDYLNKMTKSEILVVMVSGMGTISGAIMAVFAAMGVPATHMLASSVMSIPGSILIAKILLPETENNKKPEAEVHGIIHSQARNIFDAVAQGTSDGLSLALNVGAMLISFLALLALINALLGYGAHQSNVLLSYVGIAYRLPAVTLDSILGYLFSPFGILLGFTGQEALAAGRLLGIKVAVNELVAFGQMVNMSGLSERAVTILTYALCGFSNFSCIGIQVGGIGALVPEKRHLLSELGLYAVLGGALTNLLSAMIAGLLL